MSVKVVLLTNIISPHRIATFNRLAEEWSRFEVVFEKEREANRAWEIPFKKIQFPYRLVHTWSICIPTKKRYKEIYLNPKLFFYLFKARPDLVIIGGFSFQTLLVLIYCKWFSKKWILWAADLSFSESRMRRWYRSMLARCADACIPVGSLSQEYFYTCLGVSYNKQFLTYYGTDLFLEEKQPPTEEQAIPILCISRLVEKKGVHLLLKAYKMVKAKQPKSALTIVGEGPYRDRLESYCVQEGLSDVSFLGHKPYKELYSLYQRATLFVFPTLEDPWGLVVNEAMQMGVPVVCSIYAGCSKDLVIEGKTGFLVDPWDTLTMADRIVRLLDDPILCQTISKASRAHIQQFTPEATSRGFTEAIQSVCSIV